MANAAAFVTLYLITTTFLPEKGLDVPTAIANIARVLTDTNGVRFVYRFKVIGELRIIFIVEVTKPVFLERILGKLSLLARFDIESQPVITFQDFAKNIGVAEELTRHPGRILHSEDLFVFKFTNDYYGNTTDEYLAARKTNAELKFSQILFGGRRLEVYKDLAGRTQSMFLNTNNTASWDIFSLNVPLVRMFGSNARYIEPSGLQFLEDYTADVAEKDGY